MRNKAADTARLSTRYGQSELGLLPTTSTSRPSGQTTGITLTEDEQAAAQLFALGSLLQGAGAGGAGGPMSPLTAQQQAAVYAAGGSSSAPAGAVFNLPTSLVSRRTPAAEDGQCDPPRLSLNVTSFSRERISELRSVTCHIGLHSVTCHPTQVNASRLNPSQAGRYSIHVPRGDGRLS